MTDKVKRGRLSNSDKQFIENNYEKPVEELASQLLRSEGQVSKYLSELVEDLPDAPTNKEVKVKPRAPTHDRAKVVDSRTGKTAGAIATKDVSERADAFREKLPSLLNKYGSKHPSIHRPRG